VQNSTKQLLTGAEQHQATAHWCRTAPSNCSLVQNSTKQLLSLGPWQLI